MASTKISSDRIVDGFQIVVAIPFAVIGVGMLIWTGLSLLDWRDATGWVAVSATLTAVELEEHTDDDSPTYETTATYRYDYAGQTHTGHRVAIGSGADNIGDFQQRVYRDLRAAQERGIPVTAYVDPDSPSRAVLNREFRPGFLALKGAFALVFSVAGFILLRSAHVAGKKMADERTLRSRFPEDSSRWRPQSGEGRNAGSTGEQSGANDTPLPASEPRPDDRALDALGIDYERLPQGGEAWTFRRGQHKGVALAISVFAAVWAVGAVALFASNAPTFVAILFASLDVLFLCWALSLWFTEYRVTLDRGSLTLVRRGFVSHAPIEIPQQWVRAVRAKRGMQVGNKRYYDLEVETADGKHTAASSLASYDVASWLARHWMRGGTSR